MTSVPVVPARAKVDDDDDSINKTRVAKAAYWAAVAESKLRAAIALAKVANMADDDDDIAGNLSTLLQQKILFKDTSRQKILTC